MAYALPDDDEVAAIEERLHAMLAQAPPELMRAGREWYGQAEQFTRDLARAYGLPAVTVAGVIAALSPRHDWTQNKRLAVGMIAASAAGVDPYDFPAGIGHHRDTAAAILKAQPRTKKQLRAILRGRKTFPFALAMLGDTSSVTIDRHVIRAAGFDPEASISQRLFRAIDAAIRRVAAALGRTARTVQAQVWTIIRGRP